MAMGCVRCKHIDEQIRQYSIPLIIGIIAGLLFANLSPDDYEFLFGTDASVSHFELLDLELFGYPISSFPFLINDGFMVFFFGFASKGIIESLLPPNGSMYPISRATTPIIACLFGIVTPIAIYIALISILYSSATSLSDVYSYSTILNGWGVPCATDISLAWVVASFVFITNNDKVHPAISFLLILAIVDDAIGLIIIAVFYTDPDHKVQPLWMLLIIAAMIMGFISNRYLHIRWWTYYVFVVGTVSWIGFLKTRIHPALSLIPVMPFMVVIDRKADSTDNTERSDLKKYDLSMLDDYAKYTEFMVQYGLFFFTFCNAGVTFSSVGWLTLSVFCAVVFGKTIGIATSTLILNKCVGVPLPKGISIMNVPWLGYVGSMSLTVALFVANVAFQDKTLRQEAKMGALMAASMVMISCIICRFVCQRPQAMNAAESDTGNKEVELVSGTQRKMSASTL